MGVGDTAGPSSTLSASASSVAIDPTDPKLLEPTSEAASDSGEWTFLHAVVLVHLVLVAAVLAKCVQSLLRKSGTAAVWWRDDRVRLRDLRNMRRLRHLI
ncbi:hypothetical protein HK105_207210 [Polyrhizophydium stewartii]|uniref:Transmembrane protein n=1 Tax=Polyrhizophydium stewartii TaxID=2732419 RepID=A0ABR4N1C8_9FUNG|nr:hypothetical protein HK105_006015 [Polyrhizophydium stewartii]